MRDHSGSSDGRTPDVCWKLIKDRYGKPVLSPNYGPDVPDSGCPVREQSLGKNRNRGTYFTKWDTAQPCGQEPV